MNANKKFRKLKQTKTQIKTVETLERRGYDHGYTQDDGSPVMVLREKNVWVVVKRNGGYQPI